MKQKTNAELLKEASELCNELQYIHYKAPQILNELKSRKFSQEEIDMYDIDTLLNELEL